MSGVKRGLIGVYHDSSHIVSNFGHFIFSVANHWTGLLAGCFVTVIVMLIEKFALKRAVSIRIFAIILGLLLFFACYQAWLDDHTSLLGRLVDIGNLRVDNERLQGKLAKAISENTTMQSQVIDLKTQLDIAKSRQPISSGADLERKRARSVLAAILTSGNALKAECDSLQQRPALTAKAEAWAADARIKLKAIDLAYAAQFDTPSAYTFNRSIDDKPLPQPNQHIWNFLNARTEILTRILDRL